MGCFQVRSRERFPVGQNVGKRDSAVRAALGFFEKADCDRLGDRIARGWLAGVRVTGEHCESSDTSAANQGAMRFWLAQRRLLSVRHAT